MASHPYTFPIDEFQQLAFNALARDENVLVTAKTGSGKTLIGEYQIWRSMNKKKRVFYTTPIKSLTNQKFHDLKKIYPSVGIMTGDIKFAPQSDIVIMTTEILKNLLYKQGSSTEMLGITANLSLDDVDAIIFDEVHYINDPERGSVWEECFILLPPHIRLVLLSATIDSPQPFADWLTDLKGVKMNLISTTYRVVPLYHKVGNQLVMGPDNVFNDDVYTSYTRALKQKDDALRKHGEAVRSRDSDEVVKREVRDKSFIQQMNDHIDMLNRETLLPALFFVFSRKQCAAYAAKVTNDLIDTSDSAAIRHILNFHLHRYPELKTLPQYHEIEQLLLKGIAYHHSGLLPVLKEIVEILFGRGFVKVLFATETFAVGINMPTKTVVFTSYRKYDDQCDAMRLLRTDEYIQMAGRAGRRGKDDKGIVYYLPDRKPESHWDVRHMMSGRQASVSSQMRFGPEFILKAMLSGRLKWDEILTKSYWYQQMMKYIKAEVEVRDTLAKAVPPPLDCSDRWMMEMKRGDKETQRKLEAWKNRHPGPHWDAAWKDYQRYKIDESKAEAMTAEINKLMDVTRDGVAQIAKLEADGYIKDGALTKLGTMAAEINEGDALDMSRKFMEKKWHSIPVEDLVCMLAGYVGGQDAIYDWLAGGDFGEICQAYDFDAGSFMKIVLKVANVLEEWTTLATFCEDLEMLEKIRGVKERLVRGIVIPDSLYLRL